MKALQQIWKIIYSVIPLSVSLRNKTNKKKKVKVIPNILQTADYNFANISVNQIFLSAMSVSFLTSPFSPFNAEITENVIHRKWTKLRILSLVEETLLLDACNYKH